MITILIFSNTMIYSRDFGYPLDAGVRQMGIFQPYIYRAKSGIEISTHPFLLFIKPNLKVKKFHIGKKGEGLATRYSFDYPTYFLRLLQRDGIGGMLADDPDIGKIPIIFVIQSELLFTKRYSNYFLTNKFGISLAHSVPTLDTRHIIDYDLVYPRMALYHYGLGANMGLDFDYIHSEIISLKADVDIIFLIEEQPFWEHKLLFYYKLSKKYTLSIGYKLSYGHYPPNKNGEYWWNMFPLIDLSWQWTK